MSIGCIGCGFMGGAIVKALSKNQTNIHLYDINSAKSEELAQEIKATSHTSLKSFVDQSTFIILAIKPQQLKQVSKELLELLEKGKTLISILGGTTLLTLEEHFPGIEVVRMMPNLSVEFNTGMMAIVEDGSLKETTKKHIEKLFSPLGDLFWMKEDLLDGFTALCGSAPALLLQFIEAYITAAIGLGFHQDTAKKFSNQLLKGVTSLIENKAISPLDLQWQISSPKGITIEGIQTFIEEGGPFSIIHAINSMAKKSKEMS